MNRLDTTAAIKLQNIDLNMSNNEIFLSAGDNSSFGNAVLRHFLDFGFRVMLMQRVGRVAHFE